MKVRTEAAINKATKVCIGSVFRSLSAFMFVCAYRMYVRLDTFVVERQC